jgi:hypothetical protein
VDKQKPSLSLIVGVLLLGVSGNVQAVSFDLDFFAPAQSFWGPGQSAASFSRSGSFGTSDGLKYTLGASTGTVQVQNNGVLNLDYSSSARAMNLSFVGDRSGGALTTALGASANLRAFVDTKIPVPILPDIPIKGSVDIFNKTLGLQTVQPFTPSIAHPVVGIANLTPHIPVVPLGLASLDAVLNVRQTSSFTADKISGLLDVQSASFPAQSLQVPFSLTSNSSIKLPLGLSGGEWNVSASRLVLDNSFNTKFQYNLGVGASFIGNIISPIQATAGNIPIFSSRTFGLAFNQLSTPSERLSVPFSSPEPGTVLLLGSGLVGLLAWRRKQVKAHSAQSPTA